MYSEWFIVLLCAYMAFIWRIYGGVYGVYMAVYIVGYTVMAYGIGLRDRRCVWRWVWRVWSVVCTVCIR